MTTEEKPKITLSKTREYVAEYNKEYHNKKRLENPKIMCVCGKTVCSTQYDKHLETKYHKVRITSDKIKKLEENINDAKLIKLLQNNYV
jgi:hypothetical protein